MNKNSPIGVFDSGIGGLTVARHILEVLPDERIVYFGDTARVPYGNKSRETIKRFAREDIEFLLKFDVKAIVAACFTVSSNALEDIKDDYEIPVIGMIEPGVLEVQKNENVNKVGVIGTRATIESGAYTKALKKVFSGKVLSVACPLFVPLAEEGWLEHPATYLIAQEYLGQLKKEGVNTLILGCTHYPVLKEVIRKVMGEKVVLLEPGLEAGKMLKEYLISNGLTSDDNGGIEIYLSDIPRKFDDILTRFLGEKVNFVKKVEKVNPFPYLCK